MKYVVILILAFHTSNYSYVKEEVKAEPGLVEGGSVGGAVLHLDHDYTATFPGMKTEPGKAWIDEDAPPLVSFFFIVFF